MVSFAISDLGCCRSENEDAVFACDAAIGNLDNLYIVADGMGGHQAGGFASAFAIARTAQLAKDSGETSASALLLQVYEEVNREVFEKGLQNESMTGMGTTMVSCTVSSSGILTAANVGDSRLYIMNKNGSFKQLTKDHSYVEELVRKGQLERNSEAYRKAKNVITRAIGAEEGVVTDIYQLESDGISYILLCSDGLSNMVNDDRMNEILKLNISVEEKANLLVKDAKQAGGLDNISVIIIDAARE